MIHNDPYILRTKCCISANVRASSTCLEALRRYCALPDVLKMGCHVSVITPHGGVRLHAPTTVILESELGDFQLLRCDITDHWDPNNIAQWCVRGL